MMPTLAVLAMRLFALCLIALAAYPFKVLPPPSFSTVCGILSFLPGLRQHPFAPSHSRWIPIGFKNLRRGLVTVCLMEVLASSWLSLAPLGVSKGTRSSRFYLLGWGMGVRYA